MKDGMIETDSQAGQEIGFTSDLFQGYLWKKGKRIAISFIESKSSGKGNLSRLFSTIESKGYKIAVPTPLGTMIEILISKGFMPHIEKDEVMGSVEVWEKK